MPEKKDDDTRRLTPGKSNDEKNGDVVHCDKRQVAWSDRIPVFRMLKGKEYAKL